MDSRDLSSVTGRLQKALEFSREQGAASVHIRSVQAQVDAIARGDVEAVLAEAHADAALDIFAPPEFPWIRHARGAVELRRALEQNFGAVEDQRPDITNVFAEGDTVVLFGRERGRIRETGAAYDVEFVEKFTFRDGRLAAVHIIAAHFGAA